MDLETLFSDIIEGAGIEPDTEPAWYFAEGGEDGTGAKAIHEDGSAPLYGPYETREACEAAAHDAGIADPDIAEYKRREIDCRVFDGRAIWNDLLGMNAEAVWTERPPDPVEGEDARILEQALAETLRAFAAQRGAFAEFRALDRIIDEDEEPEPSTPAGMP